MGNVIFTVSDKNRRPFLAIMTKQQLSLLRAAAARLEKYQIHQKSSVRCMTLTSKAVRSWAQPSTTFV